MFITMQTPDVSKFAGEKKKYVYIQATVKEVQFERHVANLFLKVSSIFSTSVF